MKCIAPPPRRPGTFVCAGGLHRVEHAGLPAACGLRKSRKRPAVGCAAEASNGAAADLLGGVLQFVEL